MYIILKILSPSPVQMHTDVRPHVLRADAQNFVRLHPLGTCSVSCWSTKELQTNLREVG